jgi:hypothetical protein
MLLVWPSLGLQGFLVQHTNAALGNLTFAVIVTLTPGIFGYLIWELKENWRLFAANRSITLDPVLVGSHGESLPRLLRPGLHSGTIPKRFAKLRRAERKAAAADGDPRAVRKHREVLHHVETDLHRYVEREFIAWFAESRGWQLPRPQVEEIHLATNAIIVEVALPGAVEGPLVMAFELVDGRTHLVLSGNVCAESLSDPARKIFRQSIINLLKTGGIEVLDRWSAEAASPDGGAAQEIGLVAVPWPAWVAMWEASGDVPDDPAWGRLFAIGKKG